MTQRAAIYARYSTEHQSDKSIEDQVALCRRFAEREGLAVGRLYSDRARTSATLHGRRGLADLLDDARRGLFDAIVVESLDRISRDQADLATVYKQLTFAGIPILTVNEGRADTLLVGLRGLLGGIHLKDTRDKVRRGMEGVIRDGRNAGGRAYGYRPVPGQPGVLEIVEGEARSSGRSTRCT